MLSCDDVTATAVTTDQVSPTFSDVPVAQMPATFSDGWDHEFRLKCLKLLRLVMLSTVFISY